MNQPNNTAECGHCGGSGRWRPYASDPESVPCDDCNGTGADYRPTNTDAAPSSLPVEEAGEVLTDEERFVIADTRAKTAYLNPRQVLDHNNENSMEITALDLLVRIDRLLGIIDKLRRSRASSVQRDEAFETVTYSGCWLK